MRATVQCVRVPCANTQLAVRAQAGHPTACLHDAPGLLVLYRARTTEIAHGRGGMDAASGASRNMDRKERSKLRKRSRRFVAAKVSRNPILDHERQETIDHRETGQEARVPDPFAVTKRRRVLAAPESRNRARPRRHGRRPFAAGPGRAIRPGLFFRTMNVCRGHLRHGSGSGSRRAECLARRPSWTRTVTATPAIHPPDRLCCRR